MDQPKVLEQRIRDLQWLAQENVAAFGPREREDLLSSLDLAKKAIDRDLERRVGKKTYSMQQQINFADLYFEFLDAYLPVQAKLDPAFLTRAEPSEDAPEGSLNEMSDQIDERIAQRLPMFHDLKLRSEMIELAKSIFESIKRHQPSQKLQKVQSEFIEELSDVFNQMRDIDIKNKRKKYSQEQSEEYAEQEVEQIHQNVNDLIALIRDAKIDAARVKASLKTSR